MISLLFFVIYILGLYVIMCIFAKWNSSLVKNAIWFI